jgi:hypothetical protein
LSELAAIIDARLAAANPAAAIRQASALYQAAQCFLEPEEYRDRDEAMRLKALSLAVDSKIAKWLSANDCVSIYEAFSYRPGHFKTEQRFAKALRKEGLVFVEHRLINAENVDENIAALSRNSALTRKGKPITEMEAIPSVEPQYDQTEWTSKRAVDELFRRLASRRRKLDRARKAAAAKLATSKTASKKIFGKMPRKIEGKKRNAGLLSGME